MCWSIIGQSGTNKEAGDNKEHVSNNQLTVDYQYSGWLVSAAPCGKSTVMASGITC